jgi:hypothetical protein
VKKVIVPAKAPGSVEDGAIRVSLFADDERGTLASTRRRASA